MNHGRQANQARKRKTWRSFGLALVTAGALQVAPSAAPVSRETPAPVAGGLPADLAELNLDLAGLRQAELSGRADELWAVKPRLTLRAMLLRAGREVPATVTAARRAERLAEREGALIWLQQRLEGDGRALGLWEEEVRERLTNFESPVLWCATVRSLGRLSSSSFAPQIAVKIESADGQLAQAARLALFDLFLRWFETSRQFDEFWSKAQTACEESVFMETARTKEQEARELLILLLGHEPERSTELLGHSDPRLRAAAITVLGREQGEGAAAATEALLLHLQKEEQGDAFYATMNALLQTVASATGESPELPRMRAILADRIRQANIDLQAPLADALRRMPWSTQATGADCLPAGLALLAMQLQQLAAPERLTDRDVLVICMGALHSLAQQALAAELPVEAVLEPLAPIVFGMLKEPREADGVRIAAAGLLPLMSNPSSIDQAVIVLGDPASSEELSYNLLAAIGDMASQLDASDVAAQLAVETLLAQLKGGAVNLRRRSLQYLSSEAFAPLLAEANPTAFIESLGRETVPELQTQLLDLIAAHGGPAELDALIALPNFDSIAASGPAGIARLSQTLQVLAAEDGVRLVRGMGRLLAVQLTETRVLRLREALRAIAELPDPILLALGSGEHHNIVLWAMELREAAGSIPGGQPFLDRLLSVHLVGCEATTEGKALAELAHVRALFLSDLIALDPAAAQAEQVLEQFTRALTLCTESGDEPRRLLVLRDRARYQLAGGEEAAALADYNELFATELPVLESKPGAESDVLELRDLRQAGALLAGIGALPAQALRVSLVLVRQSIWSREPVALRIQDLRDLSARAVAQEDAAEVQRALLVFADLPELPPPPVEGQEPPALPATPEGALWAGLIGEVSVHTELLALASGLTSRHTDLLNPPEPPEEETPSDETPPPTEEEGGENAEGTEGGGGAGEQATEGRGEEGSGDHSVRKQG